MRTDSYIRHIGCVCRLLLRDSMRYWRYWTRLSVNRHAIIDYGLPVLGLFVWKLRDGHGSVENDECEFVL